MLLFNSPSGTKQQPGDGWCHEAPAHTHLPGHSTAAPELCPGGDPHLSVLSMHSPHRWAGLTYSLKLETGLHCPPGGASLTGGGPHSLIRRWACTVPRAGPHLWVGGLTL